MIRGLLLVIGVMMLSGCVTNVVVDGSVPTPLVSRIPANMGVYYPEEFKDFTYHESIRDAGSWSIALGEQNHEFFQNLLESLFLSVVEIERFPLDDQTMSSLDGVIVPRIEKYGFLTPQVSGLKFFSSSIEYRIELFDQDSEKIGNWTIIGYGKAEGGSFSSGDAINEATVLAIRDGGARIAIELINQKAVQEWLTALDAERQKESPSMVEPTPGL